ncbi:MAG: PqqD family protein [Gemmatimonadetes bacterium]|nr:PqqD family protein [Gemmatimonadota bacterium]
MNPKARDSHLLVHQVEDEMVVYDRTQKRAHRLNEAVAKVWSLLDGERSVNEIAGELEVDESVVALAVDDLANAQLLESSEPLSVSRRSALRRVASAAAVGVLLPVVASIPAPLAAEAESDGAICDAPCTF